MTLKVSKYADVEAPSVLCVPEEPRMGTGPCTLCDCPSFLPSKPGNTICVNQNSAGGTCNHYDYEHR